MTSLTILDLAIRDIDVPDNRARDYDEADAHMLAGVIAEQGLHHPIRVRQIGDRYRLISGLRRLRAFELLQRDMIPASISTAESDEAARLEEVMENLGRAELIALDRCHHLHELKKAWEAAKVRPLVEVLTEEGGKTLSTSDDKPEVFGFARSVAEKVGGGSRPRAGETSGKSFPTGDEQSEIFGFAQDIAEKIGLSKRAINMAVKIWTDLSPASRLRLVGTKLATKQTELKALSEEPAARQVRILDLILGGEHSEIENVAAALAYLENGIQPTALERKFRALSEGLKALPEASLDLLLVENEERIIASLKRRGRI
ncbi:ParB/RepB/Spo0J family partition protein [Tabrizicola fusiformis]|uniref:ParB/RepB/Spo0J family partition protein n=1 Tax=Tabrizicola sp. SY72 TaxID=2741673 RepID=UPI001574274D|nr:ParB N-terminal domain-containing protein [Tabrizicola sp. SY72]NTT88231.1 ParB N-terminal domain-containing protein [Tabrizicola sp. SY72]